MWLSCGSSSASSFSCTHCQGRTFPSGKAHRRNIGQVKPIEFFVEIVCFRLLLSDEMSMGSRSVFTVISLVIISSLSLSCECPSADLPQVPLQWRVKFLYSFSSVCFRFFGIIICRWVRSIGSVRECNDQMGYHASKWRDI